MERYSCIVHAHCQSNHSSRTQTPRPQTPKAYKTNHKLQTPNVNPAIEISRLKPEARSQKPEARLANPQAHVTRMVRRSNASDKRMTARPQPRSVVIQDTNPKPESINHGRKTLAGVIELGLVLTSGVIGLANVQGLIELARVHTGRCH